ncbi:hypothetical protein, partial [Nocardioides sp.]|uniref:hypothetical protein n=1 Tax=Nocardioides sp. TaxID=35761 RepID=UPI0025F594C2
RAPRNLGRYADSSASGWGVARLHRDGTTTPAGPTAYASTYTGELGGHSGSLVMDPDGSGLLLGGVRQVSYGAGGNSYGVVARIP